MHTYRVTAFVLTVVFAAVGIFFLVGPQLVQSLFDWTAQLPAVPGLPAGEVESGLFRALAVAYMYGVSVIAWMMVRRPAETIWPALLAHAKLASAAASVLLLLIAGASLIIATNAVVDGLIGLLALLLRHRAIRERGSAAAPGNAS